MELVHSIRKNDYNTFIRSVVQRRITYQYELCYEIDTAIEMIEMSMNDTNVFIRDSEFGERFFLEVITQPWWDIRFIEFAIHIGIDSQELLQHTIKHCGIEHSRTIKVIQTLRETYPELPSFDNDEKPA